MYDDENVRGAARRMECLKRTKRSTTDDLPTAASPRIRTSQLPNGLINNSEGAPSRTSLT
jgi:hypothetical protein